MYAIRSKMTAYCLYSSKQDWLSAEEENPYSVICKKNNQNTY